MRLTQRVCQHLVPLWLQLDSLDSLEEVDNFQDAGGNGLEAGLAQAIRDIVVQAAVEMCVSTSFNEEIQETKNPNDSMDPPPPKKKRLTNPGRSPYNTQET